VTGVRPDARGMRSAATRVAVRRTATVATYVASGLAAWSPPALAELDPARRTPDHLTFHGTPQRTGWYDDERVLTPRTVKSPAFGLLWESAPLPSAGETPPRLFASPLYVERVRIDADGGHVRRHDVVYAASTTGVVAAIAATAAHGVPAGTTLWQRRVTEAPCARGTNGILSTPVVDATRTRLYVVACDASRAWRVHALELGSGRDVPGWPLDLSADAINAPGVNVNGTNRFPSGVASLQRGALNLGPRGEHLFVTFGGEPVSGWVIAVDTQRVRVATAFSMTPRTEEGTGGLWASGGTSLDADGDVYVASGSSVLNALAKLGAAGVYPDSAGNWGQSIVRLSFDAAGRFRLAGTYTPFDYCQAGSRDLDLGGGAPLVVDLPRGASATPRLLVHGGSKQGNAYLLDRDRMPGSLVKRPPCAENPDAAAARDGSLLPPTVQPPFTTPAPLNVFGPYSWRFGMGDLAKSRTTPAYFRDASGRHFLFASGSAKAAEDSPVSVPPGLVRVEIVATRDARPYLRVDAAQRDLTFLNPGSPTVSSRRSRDAIVWVMDVNKPRSASLYGAAPPKPVLYAIDARTLEVLWRSAPGELHPGGKYNEAVVARGRVFVGTDRIQAFGLRPRGAWRVAAPETATGGAPGTATTDAPLATASDAEPRPSTNATAASAEAATLYAVRCASCHDQDRADVPSRAAVAHRGAASIRDKLVFGSMQGQALGMTDAQVDALAAWLASAPER
jgi:mono/diheme cytochrome c family protein